MEPNGLRLDLFDILETIKKWKKYILFFTIVATVISTIVFFLMKNTYKAYGVFYPSSAVLSGRINLFREINQDWIDLYGLDNEVDRAYVIGNSAPTISHLIRKYKMAEHYKIDTINDAKGHQKTYKLFAKKISINRTGFKNIEVSFEDEDSQLASDIVNETMYEVEDNIKRTYIRVYNSLAEALETRMKSMDSNIVVYTDSLVVLRTKYNIYDILSPTRVGNVNFTPKGNGANYARGLEEIQNVEAVKDKLVTDRAKYVSLANEFKTGANKCIPSIHVVQWATAGGPKAGPFRTLGVALTFIISLLVAAFFAVCIDTFNKYKQQRVTA